MSQGYPITLLVEGRPCLVVGAGRVAERKILSLLKAGASVRVVARNASAAVHGLAAEGAIDLQIRDYRDTDIDGAFVVVVATNDAELNNRISTECRRRGVLVNVVDQPPLCSFYVPALIQRGPVSLAISTSGAGPALAKHLRIVLEDVVGDEYGHLAELMDQLRPEVFAAYGEQSDRAAAWQRLLQSDILDWLHDGITDQARQHARELLGSTG